MTIMTARYGNVDNTSIIILTDDRGEVAIYRDEMPDDWANTLASGIQISAFESPDQDITVDMWKARAALDHAGLLAQADAAVDASGDPVLKSAWHYSPTLSMSSSGVAKIADAIGISGQQVRDLFAAATKISI